MKFDFKNKKKLRFFGGSNTNNTNNIEKSDENRKKENKRLEKLSKSDINSIFWDLNSSISGLTPKQLSANKCRYGTNDITRKTKKTKVMVLIEAFINPFNLVLVFLAFISGFTDIIGPIMNKNFEDINPVTIIIIFILIIISSLMKFIQESKSNAAANELLSMIKNEVVVDRINAKRKKISTLDLVVGDVFYLCAGDMVPADGRLIETKSLVMNQSSLTGESDPLDKNENIRNEKYDSVTDIKNLVFAGSSVMSGSAKAVVVSTGDLTFLGDIAKVVNEDNSISSFNKGINEVYKVLVKFMIIMVPIVFLFSGFLHKNWVSAFTFSLSVAIGLLPEMLPLIVTSCLSKGAISMSKKKTIIKNLSSIQDFGAMNILCTDKTGTLTEDKIVIESSIDIEGNVNDEALNLAFINSYFHTGVKNAIDEAILSYFDDSKNKCFKNTFSFIDEIPFDFQRRRLSVIVKNNYDKNFIITKGALEEMLSICSYIKIKNEIKKITDELTYNINDITQNFNSNGLRVIAVAQKNINLSKNSSFSKEDEKEMTLIGFIAFLDPPRNSSKNALLALKEHGVEIKILTGDNHRVTRNICSKVGLESEKIILGSDIEKMSKEEVFSSVKETNIFAKLNPSQKAKIIDVLKESGKIVGFMGDGINDASALKKADVGISVENAVPIAKEAADIILLDKNLMVLKDGIIEGRKTYGNMIKYIKLTASGNFGSMLSVLIGSMFLPFMPMTSLHIMLLNLVYEISSLAIPWDNVDKKVILNPRPWNAKDIIKFMLATGPISTIFDVVSYAVLYFWICPLFTNGILYHQLNLNNMSNLGFFSGLSIYVSVFQTGWLLECLWTQVLVFFVLRTENKSIFKNSPSILTSFISIISCILVTLFMYTPTAKFLGLISVPVSYYIFLMLVLFSYLLLANFVKRIYIKFNHSWL